MRALVTGALGFVGQFLVRELRERGWRVTTLDRRRPADIAADLAREEIPALSFDAVFHLAGQANPTATVDTPEEAYASNAAGTARVARSMKRGRLVLASSIHVYGEVPPEENPIEESRPPRPATPYGASKLCGEALALGAWKDVVILRPTNHTGPGQRISFICPEIARQVALAEAGLGPRTLRVRDLAPRIDLFDVRDMARAYRLAAERARPGGVYNVARGEAVSVRQIVETLARLSRVALRISGNSTSASLKVGDPSRFRRETGWKAAIPLERTLQDLLEAERRRIRAGASAPSPPGAASPRGPAPARA
jgi:GDP-4-dehydro-6-deoxy-D-mannose reductase